MYVQKRLGQLICFQTHLLRLKMLARRRGIDDQVDRRADGLLIIRLSDPVAQTVSTVCRLVEAGQKTAQRNLDLLGKGTRGHRCGNDTAKHLFKRVVVRRRADGPLDEKSIGVALVSDQSCPLGQGNLKKLAEQDILVQRSIGRVHNTRHLCQGKVCVDP